MAQRKPDPKNTMTEVLKLVGQLSPEELLELRQQLDSKTWGDRFRQLVKDVAEDTKDEPQLTDEEIVQEVIAYRKRKVHKVVIDTNVWIRALLGSKAAVSVVDKLDHDLFQLTLAEPFVIELTDVLSRPKFATIEAGRSEQLIALLREKATLIALEHVPNVSRDPKLEKKHGSNNTKIATELNRLALILDAQGKRAEAVKIRVRVQNIVENQYKK